MICGYARVSGPGQDLAGQLARLSLAGCNKFWAEKESGAAGRKRPELQGLLAALQPGDLVLIVRMNRIARSARDGLNIIAAVISKGAEFRSLEEPWADTTSPMGRALTTVLLGFAELDREMILQRTAEGRRAAMAAGVKMGRKRSLTGHQRAYAVASREKSPPTPYREIAAVLQVHTATVKREVARGRPEASELDPAGQIDLEDAIRRKADHAPTCAVFTSGLGNTVRCTCGQVPRV